MKRCTNSGKAAWAFIRNVDGSANYKAGQCPKCKSVYTLTSKLNFPTHYTK